MKNPTLTIEIDNDLSSLIFREGEKILGQIDYPRLLWECSCQPQSGGQSPVVGPCRVHSCEGAERIEALFGNNTRIIFRGMELVWRAKSAWPPAIDSLLLIKTLSDCGWPSSSFNHVWDAGAGTGFLGMQVALSNLSITDITSVEIDPFAAKLCNVNLARFQKTRAVQSRTYNSAFETIPEQAFSPKDVIISNPPYLPAPPETTSIPVNPAFGTDLLIDLIARSTHRGIPIAFCYSALSQPEVDQALIKCGATEFRILAEYSLPLRIYCHPLYLQWLIDERNLITLPDDVFAYHHILRIATMSPALVN